MEPITFGPSSPLFDPSDLQQGYFNSCAVKSQELILNLFGKNVTEDQLVEEASSLHIFSHDSGTPIYAMGDLLELHGVQTTAFTGANQYTLLHELAQGHQVIVALDSKELWAPGLWEKLMDFLGLSGANHALIVSSIDTSDPEHIMVNVADPGTGKMQSYEWEQFSDAWADSNFHMVATNEAPMESSFMSHFDGVVGSIMGLPFDEWMDSFGSMVQTGMELTGEFVNFLQDNPEIVNAALTLAPALLCDMDGVDIDSIVSVS